MLQVDVGGGGGDVVVDVKAEGMEDMTVDGVDDRMEGGRIEKDGTAMKEDEEEEREEDYVSLENWGELCFIAVLN